MNPIRKIKNLIGAERMSIIMESNLAYKLEPLEEVIGGEIVMMATPTSNHNRVTGNIYHLFRTYLGDRKCEPFPDREALYLEDDAEEYQPDGMIVCDPDKVKPDGVHGAPDLVVEVLSPSTGKNDKGHKKAVYEKHGVREYWIVSPAERSIEQYVLENGSFVLRDVYQQYPEFMLKRMKEEEKAALVTEFQSAVFDGLTVRLDDVFYRVTPGV